MVDAHCKCAFCPMKTTTADSTINALRNIFARYGLPTQVVSDDGPPFQSAEYEQFLGQNDIQRILVSSSHPSSNRLAERFVQTFKYAMESSADDPQALYSDGSGIFSYLTEAHHTLLPAHPPPNYSCSTNFALDCLWLHLILDLAWPASKTK